VSFTKTYPTQQKRTFQVSPPYQSILNERKCRIQNRLNSPRALSDLGGPEFRGTNIHYEMADKIVGHGCGGIGIIHQLVNKLGLAAIIDDKLELLAFHKPYHESDHVLAIAYNILAGGTRLEDLELRRQDEAFLNCLGARRLPDPTTAGDFTRRFNEEDVLTLQEAINTARCRVWSTCKTRSQGFLREAFIDVDGTIAPTLGECKEGMNMSYKGLWGYHPLLVTLANTREVLYCVNRPGNVVSHEDNAVWLNRAIELVQPYAGVITLRGDTDFTNSAYLGEWDAKGVQFIFGMDANAKLVGLADSLQESAWTPLERLPKYEIATSPRERPDNVKEEIVIQRGYTNKILKGESVSEFDYQPGKSDKAYRMVVLRKNISVMKGEALLIDEIVYFFYVTNKRSESKEQIVGLANGRCDQENIIEQAKNGVNAMRLPVQDLVSNWAYMVMALLAWNLKAWYGLILPDEQIGQDVVGMEMRRFMLQFLWLPVQIVRTGRKIIFRIIGYNGMLRALFAQWEMLRRWRPAWGGPLPAI
jgi:hypothetical protein